jgi:sugar O-acyltransferase (sialic acid O-acetyltransferase NeuD family)
MNKEKVIIVGSSGHSKVILDIFEKQGKYEIIGLLDAYRTPGEETLGYRVLGKEEDLPVLLEQYPDGNLFVAIGDNWIRHKVVMKIMSLTPNVNFASAIHPSAQIGKHVRIGNGVAVMAGAVVNADTQLGDFTIVNTGACIDHDSHIAAFSSLAPGVKTGGKVFVGEFSAVSIGATLLHGVSVGKHTVIGAASLVLKNCGDNLIMYGVPAREIRKRESGEKYL